MKAFVVSDQQANYLVDLIVGAMEVDARCLSRIDPAISPVMYRDARRDLRIGSELLAVLNTAAATLPAQERPPSAVSVPQLREYFTDDDANLFPVPEELRDIATPEQIARARDPRCIHNRKRSEPCEECDKAGPIIEPPSPSEPRK